MAEMKPARVVAIQSITPSIKRLLLDTREHPIAFRPGQWVDLHLELEGEPVVGGYSITSTPARSDQFELAIKRAATHRATKAVHEGLSQGDVVGYAGGQGGFTLRESEDADTRQRLMIAGGIGITPIMSMIRHLDETQPEASVNLLYSARGSEELAFREELDEIAGRRAGFEIRYFVTGNQASNVSTPNDGDAASGVTRRRINRDALEAALAGKDTDAYLCGPPPMTESMVALLEDLGMAKPQIHFERWW
jgi:ferredoxin-NADP reductase